MKKRKENGRRKKKKEIKKRKLHRTAKAQHRGNAL